MGNNEESKFAFTKALPDRSTVEEIVSESELTQEHKDLLLGQLVRDFGNAPVEIQKKFLAAIAPEVQAKTLKVSYPVVQEWVETEHSKTGWESNGWYLVAFGDAEVPIERQDEIENFVLNKFGNPIAGTLELTTEEYEQICN